MVGFTPDGEVVNVNVLRQADDPVGYGDKMDRQGNVAAWGKLRGQRNYETIEAYGGTGKVVGP